MNKKNGKDWAGIFSCSFLEQGLVSYEDSGAGVALLRKETIDKMLPSILGKPVIIDHQDATPDNFAEMAVGYVSDAFFNPDDGWFHCKFILIDEEAKAMASKGFSVSCAYDVKATVGGGEWHAIPYDEEITDGFFTHLALVQSPRYEACKIYVNSKKAAMGMPKQNDNKESDMLFGKKNEKKEEGLLADHGRMVTLPNGQEISMGELVNSFMEGLKSKDEGKEEAGDKENRCHEKEEDKKEEKPEDKENEKEEGEEGEPEAVEHTEMLLQVKAMLDAGDIEGAKAILAQVTSAEAQEIDGGLNKEAPDNKIQMHATNEKEEEEDKENEKKDEKEDEEKDTKENSKRNAGYFRLLNSAALMGEDGVGELKVATFDSRINKGAERYGSKK